jgi:hypothetical protein
MRNLGMADRTIRIFFSVPVLLLAFALEGNMRYFALIGVLPLLTGLVGFCPAYLPFRLNTTHD